MSDAYRGRSLLVGHILHPASTLQDTITNIMASGGCGGSDRNKRGDRRGLGVGRQRRRGHGRISREMVAKGKTSQEARTVMRLLYVECRIWRDS